MHLLQQGGCIIERKLAAEAVVAPMMSMSSRAATTEHVTVTELLVSSYIQKLQVLCPSRKTLHLKANLTIECLGKNNTVMGEERLCQMTFRYSHVDFRSIWKLVNTKLIS